MDDRCMCTYCATYAAPKSQHNFICRRFNISLAGNYSVPCLRNRKCSGTQVLLKRCNWTPFEINGERAGRNLNIMLLPLSILLADLYSTQFSPNSNLMLMSQCILVLDFRLNWLRMWSSICTCHSVTWAYIKKLKTTICFLWYGSHSLGVNWWNKRICLVKTGYKFWFYLPGACAVHTLSRKVSGSMDRRGDYQ
jgi:hypothetical protein